MTLLQVIKRMHYLEYSIDEIQHYLSQVSSNTISIDDLLNTLDIEPLHPAVFTRFKEVLQRPDSVKSALNVMKIMVS